MKEVVITSIGSKDGEVNTNIWEIKFTVKQNTPIKYELNGVLDWKGDPFISDIQAFLEKLTQEVKTKTKRRRTK